MPQKKKPLNLKMLHENLLKHEQQIAKILNRQLEKDLEEAKNRAFNHDLKKAIVIITVVILGSFLVAMFFNWLFSQAIPSAHAWYDKLSPHGKGMVEGASLTFVSLLIFYVLSKVILSSGDDLF
jgi:hypothetical protein